MQPLLSNPVPGLLGSMNPASYRGLGTFTLNMQASKAVTLNAEHNVTLRLRADAINLLNRPIWGTPNPSQKAVVGRAASRRLSGARGA